MTDTVEDPTAQDLPDSALPASALPTSALPVSQPSVAEASPTEAAPQDPAPEIPVPDRSEALATEPQVAAPATSPDPPPAPSAPIEAASLAPEIRAEKPKVPRVLAIANQKGGVGKTTTAINLGTALAAIGEHVLIVDLDPQGNASTGLGIERKARRTSTYDVMTGAAPMREAVIATAVPQLYIAPSTMDLSGLELEIGQQRDRAYRLRNALAEINSGTPHFDFTYVLLSLIHI